MRRLNCRSFYFFIALCTISLASCQKIPWFSQTKFERLESLEKAETIISPATSSRNTQLPRDTSSPIYVHFWATWCEPCLRELPEFVEFARTHSLALTLVNEDDEKTTGEKYLREQPWVQSIEQGMNIRSVFDPSQKIAKQFGTFQYPETYVLHPKTGEVLFKQVGEFSWKKSGKELHRIMSEKMQGIQ